MTSKMVGNLIKLDQKAKNLLKNFLEKNIYPVEVIIEN